MSAYHAPSDDAYREYIVRKRSAEATTLEATLKLPEKKRPPYSAQVICADEHDLTVGQRIIRGLVCLLFFWYPIAWFDYWPWPERVPYTIEEWNARLTSGAMDSYYRHPSWQAVRSH